MKKKWKKCRTERIEVRWTTTGCTAIQVQGLSVSSCPEDVPAPLGEARSS